MSYVNNDTNNATNGWGVGLSAIIGGALGYWAGRSGNPGFGGPGYGYPPYFQPSASVDTSNGGCRTCYQEGMETGQQLAGINFTAQRAAANAAEMRTFATDLSNQMNATLATINNRFDALSQQKIADQAAEIAALRTQNLVGMNAAATNAQLNSISDKLSAITAGCAVRAVPGCPMPNLSGTTACGCNG